MPASGPSFDQKFHSQIVNVWSLVLKCMETNSSKIPLESIATLQVYKSCCLRILFYVNKEKMVAVQCCVSSILTNSKIKDNYFLQLLLKCSFPRDQISSRAYKHVKVSKYHKIFLGRTILWP